MKNINKVAVSSSIPKSHLFPILGKCFNVTFTQDDDFGKNDYIARIFYHHDTEPPYPFSSKCHTYVISKKGTESISPKQSKPRINFSNSSLTPRPFRNRIVDNFLEVPYWQVIGKAEYKAISSIDGICTWAINKSNGYHHYEVGMDLPFIPKGDPLFKWFNGRNFIELLPLIDFLRNITGVSEYSRPKQAACIIFDDPNLHFARYGFIKFDELAQHAKSNNYHVAFATIPLDLFYANKKAVNIFENNYDRLSILIHGNNHLSHELGYDYDEKLRISLLSQALTRIRKFERRYGLSVSRVMAAPHGACTELMLRDMARSNLEGACISFGSLFNTNRSREWVIYMGTSSSSIISGLPVFNRFPFSLNCLNQVLLAVYLGQPIIPYGHNWDVKDNLDSLKYVAGIINSLDEVQWGSLREISRINYLAKTDGEELKVKVMSRNINLTVPSGIRSIRIEGPDLLDDIRLDNFLYAVNGADFCGLAPGNTITARPGDEIIISSPCRNPIDLSQMHLPSTPIKAILRRFATEARDRLRPYAHRFRVSLSNKMPKRG